MNNMAKYAITCFMIVRNVLSQGYPFLEAITQALPVCDELLVSDGYSTDGTYEALLKASKVNRKIKLFREEWPNRGFHETLRIATNNLRWKCRGDYIFYIQANEIIHEDSWDYLRVLPEVWPKAITFSLPYILLYGTLKFHEQYRLRYARNLDYIEAIYDAWALGLKKTFIAREILKSIINPYHLARIIYKGIHRIYAFEGGIPKYTVPVILPKPIYRYQAVFPGDTLRKELERAKRWGKREDEDIWLRKLKELETSCRNHKELMHKAYEDGRRGMTKRGHQVPNYPPELLEVPISEHPEIMRPLLEDTEHCFYYIREEIYETMRRL